MYDVVYNMMLCMMSCMMLCMMLCMYVCVIHDMIRNIVCIRTRDGICVITYAIICITHVLENMYGILCVTKLNVPHLSYTCITSAIQTIDICIPMSGRCTAYAAFAVHSNCMCNASALCYTSILYANHSGMPAMIFRQNEILIKVSEQVALYANPKLDK
jgi:hypothetical protein